MLSSLPLSPAVGARVLLRALYNSDQPRDPQGRWDDSGGTYFHGTTEARAGLIAKGGLNSREIWLTSSRSSAYKYAKIVARMEKSIPAVLRVQIPAGHRVHLTYNKTVVISKKAISAKHIQHLRGLGALEFDLRDAGDVVGHEFHGNQWTTGVSATERIAAQQRLKTIAAGRTHVPVSEFGIAHVEYAQMPNPEDSVHDSKGRGVITPTSQVVSVQPTGTIEVAKLQATIASYNKWKDAADNIDVHQHLDGKSYVTDGHHRLIAARLLGKNVSASIHAWGGAVRALGGPGSGNFGHAGRPGEVGGSATDDSWTEANSIGARSIVERRAGEVAREMGVDPNIIHVVDKEPTPFVVGNQQFKEAGHYDPSTGQIEINARNSYDGRMSVTNGIAAHEVSHAMWDRVLRVQEAEHREINNLPKGEFNRLFRASGYVRPETQAEVHERWPVSAMMYRHLGDSYMETEDEQRSGSSSSRYTRMAETLQREDGVTAYSTAYWQREALDRSGGFERAINETLAETTRYHVAPASFEQGQQVSLTWQKFSRDLRATYARLNR